MRWRSYDAISGHTIFLEKKNKSRLYLLMPLYILRHLLPGLIIISYYEIRNNDGGVVIKTDGRRFLLLCNWGRRCLEVYCVYLPNQRKEMEQKIKSWLRIRNYMCWITQDYKLFNKKRRFFKEQGFLCWLEQQVLLLLLLKKRLLIKTHIKFNFPRFLSLLLRSFKCKKSEKSSMSSRGLECLKVSDRNSSSSQMTRNSYWLSIATLEDLLNISL